VQKAKKPLAAMANGLVEGEDKGVRNQLRQRRRSCSSASNWRGTIVRSKGFSMGFLLVQTAKSLFPRGQEQAPEK
jgi:hypothetical protein